MKKYAIFFAQNGDGLNAKFLTSVKNPNEGSILPNTLGNGFFILCTTEEDEDWDKCTWFCPLFDSNVIAK
jgi:hypothetical protein